MLISPYYLRKLKVILSKKLNDSSAQHRTKN